MSCKKNQQSWELVCFIILDKHYENLDKLLLEIEIIHPLSFRRFKF